MKLTLKIFSLFVFMSLLVIRPTPSLADWGHHDHGYVGVHIGVWGGGPYYYDPYYHPYYHPYYYHPYYADPYYYPTYAVAATSTYQPVVINGVTYYLNNGQYYIYTQYGYQAVAAPVEAQASVPSAQTTTSSGYVSAESSNTGSDDAVTINIPNSKGGYTAVILKKSGSGFVGPQGEFYPSFPKVSQLQTIYGK